MFEPVKNVKHKKERKNNTENITKIKIVLFLEEIFEFKLLINFIASSGLMFLFSI